MSSSGFSVEGVELIVSILGFGAWGFGVNIALGLRHGVQCSGLRLDVALDISIDSRARIPKWWR